MKKVKAILSMVALLAAGLSGCSTGAINGHEYVDLGLSVKWATCNVGASEPWEYGDYYAWGETETKSSYDEENSMTYGKNMGNIAGNSDFDAATVHWGGAWRMPTKDEISELVDKCQWEWTTQGDHKGYQVTGPNGNSIFLPAAGNYYGTMLYGVGGGGYYWSSSPYESRTNFACYLFFNSSNFYLVDDLRFFGRSVRPVTEYRTMQNRKLEKEAIKRKAQQERKAAERRSARARKTTGAINGHDYVDLGLSVKWATCNVGASEPWEHGNYYAWGETTTKSSYDEGNSIMYERNIWSITNNPAYDAATTNWGGTWRLPTADEIKELVDKCQWKRATLDDHNGYRVTGPNGKSIFLPAAGFYNGTTLYSVGESGIYWSSSPYEGYTGLAYGLGFGSGFFDLYYDFSRCHGRSVRPVIDK